MLITFRYNKADFESEEQQTKHSNADTISTNQLLIFEDTSSEDDNPLNWDPVVEACNKHVALSQVDSGIYAFARTLRLLIYLFTFSSFYVFSRPRFHGSPKGF